MHFPVSVQIGSYNILLHTVFETAAFFIGFRYFLFLRKRLGDAIEPSNRIWIIIGAIFGSLIGSRLVGGLEDIEALQVAPNKVLYFYQNKTVVGGFIGGLFGVEFIKKCINERTSSGDLFVYPMLLALIIGRIGCFSMGIYEETYGVPTQLPWSINLGDGLYRHPVSLYEIVFLIGLWIAFVQIQKRYKLMNGSLFKLFMISYLTFRFLLDFIKPHYTFNIGLSTIQISCMLALVYYYRYIVKPKRLLAAASPEEVVSSVKDEVTTT
jgi:phosphatidylglycerol---prolipoprotein diacylglyceryl transferase